MTKAHAIWLVLSMSLSYGTNHLLRPSFDYDALSAGPTLASGELEASGITRGTIKLVDLRVIAADVETMLGGPLPVRELLMRGALGEGQNETDLEMFVDFSREDGAPIDPESPNIEVLKGRPLKVLAEAVAGDARSRIRLPGSDGPAFVKQGTLTIDEALELQAGVWRVRGELDIELERGGEVSSLFARLAGKIVWE